MQLPSEIPLMQPQQEEAPVDFVYNNIQDKAPKTNRDKAIGEVGFQNKMNSLVNFNTSPKKLSFQNEGFKVGDAYTKLTNGNYITRYDDFLQGSNNEQRHADKQSTGSKWVNGLGKFVGKTIVNTVGGTIGTAWGAIDAIGQGNWERIYDNSFYDFLDDQNTKMDNFAANYRTQEEQNNGFGASMGTANFWADDFLGGLSFMTGTVLSESIWAAATGGTSLTTAWTRVGLRASKYFKTAQSLTKGVKEASKSGKGLLRADQGREAAKKAVKYGKAGEAANLLRFTYTGAGYEAGMEARLYQREQRDNFYRDFETLNGRKPTSQEVASFEDTLNVTTNGLWAMNMALLGTSNFAVLGKTFGITSPFKGSSKSLNKILYGQGTTTKFGKAGERLSTEAIKRTKLQRGLGVSKALLKNPFYEGIVEEGGQATGSTAMESYLTSRYNPNKESIDIMEGFYDGFAHTYGTKEGWKEVGLGMLIGFVGGEATNAASGGGFFTEARNAYQKEGGKVVEQDSVTGEDLYDGDRGLANEMTENRATNVLDKVFGTKMQEDIADATNIQNENEAYEKALEKGDVMGMARAESAILLTSIQKAVDNDYIGEQLADFQTAINMRSNEEIMEAYDISENEVAAKKTKLMDGFREMTKSYEKAKSFADYIVSDNPKELFDGATDVDVYQARKAIAYQMVMTGVMEQNMDGAHTTLKQQILNLAPELSKKYNTALDELAKINIQNQESVRKVAKVETKIAQKTRKRNALIEKRDQIESQIDTEGNIKDSIRTNKIQSQIDSLGKELEGLQTERAELKATWKQTVSERDQLQTQNSQTQQLAVELNRIDPLVGNDLVEETSIEKTQETLAQLDKTLAEVAKTNPELVTKIQKLAQEYQKGLEMWKRNADTMADLANPELGLKRVGTMMQKKKQAGTTTLEFLKRLQKTTDEEQEFAVNLAVNMSSTTKEEAEETSTENEQTRAENSPGVNITTLTQEELDEKVAEFEAQRQEELDNIPQQTSNTATLEDKRADIEKRRQEQLTKIIRSIFPNTKLNEIVYHGTRTQDKFDTFDETKIGELDGGYFGRGFYFSPDKSYAEGYSKQYNGYTIAAILNLQNPLETDANKANTNISLENNDGAIVRVGENLNPELNTTEYDSNEIGEVVVKNSNQIHILSEKELNNIDKINAKYDAELASMEDNTSQQTSPTLTNKTKKLEQDSLTLRNPTITSLEEGELYEFNTEYGIVAGVMISPTEFRIDGISAREVGKGSGSKLFEGLIKYLSENNVKRISTKSAGQGAVTMHNKAVKKGLLTKLAEDGRTATFQIENKSEDQYSLESLNSLPILENMVESYNKALDIINNIDFNTKSSVDNGISLLANHVANKNIGDKASKYIRNKSKLIGSPAKIDKEYLQKYINIIYKDFSQQSTNNTQDKVDVINAKYDAELASMEDSSVATDNSSEINKINKKYDKKIATLKNSSNISQTSSTGNPLQDKINNLERQLKELLTSNTFLQNFTSDNTLLIEEEKPTVEEVQKYKDLRKKATGDINKLVTRPIDQIGKRTIERSNLTITEIEEYRALNTKLGNWRTVLGTSNDTLSVQDILNQIEAYKKDLKQIDTQISPEQAFEYAAKENKDFDNNETFSDTINTMELVNVKKGVETQVSHLSMDTVRKNFQVEQLEDFDRGTADKPNLVETYELTTDNGTITIYKDKYNNRLYIPKASTKQFLDGMGMQTVNTPTATYWGYAFLNGVPMESDFGIQLIDGTEVMAAQELYNLKEGDEVGFTVEMSQDYNANEILEMLDRGDMEQATAMLSIFATDKNGKVLGFVQSKRADTQKSNNLDLLRAKAIEMFMARLEQGVSIDDLTNNNIDTKITLPFKTSVKKVFIGVPNMELNEDGNAKEFDIKPEHVKTADNENGIIISKGFSKNGKINEPESVRRTFMPKDKSVPYVVIRHGETDIAFPVGLKPSQGSLAEQAIEIIESDLREAEKQTAIIDMARQNGIEAAEYNLDTNQGVNKLLEDLGNKPRTYSEKELNDMSLEDFTAAANIIVNLDKTPFLSAKVKTDLTGNLENLDTNATTASEGMTTDEMNSLIDQYSKELARSTNKVETGEIVREIGGEFQNQFNNNSKFNTLVNNRVKTTKRVAVFHTKEDMMEMLADLIDTESSTIPLNLNVDISQEIEDLTTNTYTPVEINRLLGKLADKVLKSIENNYEVVSSQMDINDLYSINTKLTPIEMFEKGFVKVRGNFYKKIVQGFSREDLVNGLYEKYKNGTLPTHMTMEEGLSKEQFSNTLPATDYEIYRTYFNSREDGPITKKVSNVIGGNELYLKEEFERDFNEIVKQNKDDNTDLYEEFLQYFTYNVNGINIEPNVTLDTIEKYREDLDDLYQPLLDYILINKNIKLQPENKSPIFVTQTLEQSDRLDAINGIGTKKAKNLIPYGDGTYASEKDQGKFIEYEKAVYERADKKDDGDYVYEYIGNIDDKFYTNEIPQPPLSKTDKTSTKEIDGTNSKVKTTEKPTKLNCKK